MIKTILPKAALTALALTAALTLTARAGGPLNFSSARGKQGVSTPARNPFHIFPQMLDDSTYEWDDGTSEDAVSFGLPHRDTASAAWFNQFNVVTGGEQISAIQIAWGTRGNRTSARRLNGLPVTIGIWNDPDNDGRPNDAVLIASVDGTIQNANTDRFVTYTFDPPVVIGPAGTSFFIGDVTPAVSNDVNYIEALDETTARGHSWAASMSDGSQVDYNQLGNNDVLGRVQKFGLSGNWLIRGTNGSSLTLMSTASRKVSGSYGKFDVPLPGIEDREGPADIVFNFSGNVMSVNSSSSTCGDITNVKIVGNSVIVQLDNDVCDQQTVTVTLNGVHDTSGNTLATASAMVGFLLGDVNNDGTVDGTDISIVNSNLGQPVTDSNFRSDVLANGQINAMDRREVSHNLGHSL
jgi:hypothetical protein